jgi:chromate transporter
LSIALLAFLALLFKVDVLLTIVVCGGLGILLNVNFRQHRLYAFVPWLFAPWFVPGAYASLEGTGGWRVLGRAGELFAVFVKLGTIVWGGGFAAIPFIKQEVVDLRLWLSAREFIDGVALSQITPGPVAILATFVGYRTLGLAGAVLATLGFFLPSFLMLLLVLRVYDRIRDHYLVRGFLQGILPAVVGMLLSAALLVGKEAISGIPTGALALVSLLALVLIKLDPVWLVLGGGLVGLLLGARLG